jgi:diacylglycerol O-acyltransferase
MQPLSGLDSMFLSLESQTNLFQVGAVAVLDPSTSPAGSPPPHQALRRVIEDRLHLLAPFRRRVATVPGGIGHPFWVDDHDPDLDRHLVRGALPSPGGAAELARYAADVLARPLDRRRPLWELHTVEGLDDGLVAAVAKLHHSAIDGIAGAEVTGLLMDLTPDVAGPMTPADDEHHDRVPSAGARLVGALGVTARRAPATVGTLARLPLASARIRRRKRRGGTVAPPTPFQTPRTSLSARLGPQRAVGFATVERHQVDQVRAATGATVNDVILALAAGALREHLAQAAELPAESLVAFVPVSTRPTTDAFGGTNRLSGMLVSLATTAADPLLRLSVIIESARSAKAQNEILGPDLLSGLAELAVPSLLGPLGRLARSVGLTTRRPPFSVIVSSFPGPSFPLFCAGAEMIAYHPFGPIVDGAALNITAMSYRDQISFGLLADPDAIGRVDVLAERITEAMGELEKSVVTSR